MKKGRKIESLMKNMIQGHKKNHEIFAFITLTFLCSWAVWGILYCSFIGIIDTSLYKRYSVLFICSGAYAPSILSIILTGLLNKKRGVKELLYRLIQWRYHPAYYVISVFYCLILIYSSYLICRLMGYKGEIKLINNPFFILNNFFLVLLVGGPFNEEIGWRGFLLPRLQRCLNPFLSGAILGIIWAVWHLPMFFIVGTGQYGYPFLQFMLDTTLASIFITWLFNKTEGSLIFSILFHTGNNVWNSLIYGKDNFFIGAKEYIYYAVQIIVIIFIVYDIFRKKTIPYTSAKIES